jgi:4-hydroxybenzoate polyprenyltransferase
MLQASKSSFLKDIVILIKSRREALGLWMWASMVFSLLVGRGFPPLIPTLLTLLSVFFTVTAVYIYNDIIDIDADKNNSVKKDRPLPSGAVPLKNARYLVYISAIIGVALSYYLNIISFIFTLTYLLLFLIYSYPPIHLKKKFLIKESVIVTGLFLVNITVSYAIMNSFSWMAMIGTIFFAIYGFAVMPAAMDSTDVFADKLQGVKTLASVLSWKRRIQLMMSGILLIMTLTPFTYLNFGFNMILPIFVVLSCLVFLRYAFPIMNHFDKVAVMNDEYLLRTKRLIIIFNLVMNIFVIIGSINLALILPQFF